MSMQRVCLSKDIAAVERDEGDDKEQECLLVTEEAALAEQRALIVAAEATA